MDIAWLANYPLLTVAANLTSVVGFGLAIFFYFRSKEKVALSYNITEKLLIQPSTELPFDMDVPLSWDGKQLTRLTRSFILVSNTGNQLVERSDLVGFAFVLAILIVRGLVGLVLSYFLRRGTKETKRAWVVFMEISNNSKGALP